jgi:hypothetical protein
MSLNKRLLWIFCALVFTVFCVHMFVKIKSSIDRVGKCYIGVKFTTVNWLKVPVTEIKSYYLIICRLDHIYRACHTHAHMHACLEFWIPAYPLWIEGNWELPLIFGFNVWFLLFAPHLLCQPLSGLFLSSFCIQGFCDYYFLVISTFFIFLVLVLLLLLLILYSFIYISQILSSILPY